MSPKKGFTLYSTETTNCTMRLILTLILIISVSITRLYASDALESGFTNPPSSAKARTWWHWINGNITKEGITADLEAMRQAGVQEAQIFNVNLGDPQGPAAYLSPEWLDLFKHAGLEAKRLGLELGFHNGAGWSSSGGPWITPEHAMQTLVSSQITHKGGKPFKARLPQPDTRLNFYKDIAVLAFPIPKSNQRIDNLDFKNLSGRIRNHLMPDAKIIPTAALIKKSEIVDLTVKVTDDGYLEWNAAEGEWVILRLGHTPTSKKNHPAAFGGHGLECDKMSRKAADVFWEGGIDPILEKLDSLVGSVLTNCLIDSYEVGTANWTSGFDKAFKRFRGYDCLPFLPTLAGYYVESGEITERFLWDFRRTIGDLMAENYYAYFRQRCHQHGMNFSVEPYWGPFDSMQVGETGDIIMCEFWSGNVAFFDSPKFVASIAKLNGDSIVGAEAFTGMGGWTQHPATIKSIGDKAWAQGINRFIFHSYVHQPWDVGPGLTLSYHGLEFNRLNTWWDQGVAYLDYVARSQFLLQQGSSVADILLFTGEASPNNALQMPEIKAMGYDYDLIGVNKIGSLSANDGLIRTKAGGSYRALVLPETTWIRPETLKKLQELAEAGATILGPKPQKSPSLHNYPECDEQVTQLSDKLWDAGLIKEDSIVDLFTRESFPPDFDVENSTREDLDFIHRKLNEVDIYFVANSRKEKRQEQCRFRVTGKQPELWDAETGQITNALVWQDNGDGTTSIPVQFDSEDSIFVVFRKSLSSSGHIIESTIELDRPPAAPLPSLKIIKAEYGTFLQEGLVDVTQFAAKAVKDNQLYMIANRELCDCDPAPGYKKELRIKYKIGDSIHATCAMEQEAVDIDAGDEGELKVLRAVFGKFDRTTHGVPFSSPASDVTKKIESLVMSGIIHIAIDDGLIGGPSGQGKDKELRIVYSTDGELRTSTIPAGRNLNLTRSVPEPAFVFKDDEINWVTPYPGQLTYRTSSGESETIYVKTVPKLVEFTGPWDVSFPANLGAPALAIFDELTSWSSSSNEGIRYFSGTANYKQLFVLPKHLIRTGISLELDLGSVRMIAEVVVNGKNLGILWKAPFRLNLDGIVNEGANTLEVRITNLWPNRLVGDEHLPQDFERKGPNVKNWPSWLLNETKRPSERVAFTAYKHWSKDATLQSSGMLGPVTIRPYVRVKVKH
ncbi:glycosyl hydrolase [Bythopirellula polymerisocia]|uniref:Glycosyl hydrolases family 2, sugar binding domain n=1 Tax=Bythopirellula polymerisocia TaxID=2528003 RepID=A0A5C6CYP5_9BACT|nr:glycosyl hydrolase [Bythopirellula polymerisocia]TWU28657.1 hypothetical protein Pla144_19490 [Bythopirellula polymerisocia]